MIKGFKVFDPNFCCRGFQYEIGKTYEHIGEIEPCRCGFHFCEKLVDCYDYYDFNQNNKIAEVIAHGNVSIDGNKSVTNKIEIVKEIAWNDCLNIVNTGNGNTGKGNTGDRNTGYRNTGDLNTGDRNTGDLNKTNFSSGVFCTQEQKILIFDKPSEMTLQEWRNSEFASLFHCYTTNAWVCESDMTDQEKIDHPKFYVQGGYLKMFTPEETWQNWYKDKTQEEMELVKRIPNFDYDKFKFITGVDLKC